MTLADKLLMTGRDYKMHCTNIAKKYLKKKGGGWENKRGREVQAKSIRDQSITLSPLDWVQTLPQCAVKSQLVPLCVDLGTAAKVPGAKVGEDLQQDLRWQACRPVLGRVGDVFIFDFVHFFCIIHMNEEQVYESFKYLSLRFQTTCTSKKVQENVFLSKPKSYLPKALSRW